MEQTYYSFSLKLLNLFIGLCRGAAGLPEDLRMLGYQDKGIELPFQNAQGERVQPELIVSSETTGHTFLCEWKSGANIDENQLNRYAAITSDDLRQRAFLPATAVRSHDTAIFGLDENLSRLTIGMQRASCSFPLLSVSQDQIILEHNNFSETNLNGLFQSGLHVDMATAPMSFVPFDRESPDWVFAQYCCNQIVYYMQRGHPSIILDTLIQDVVVPWPMIGQEVRNELKRKISSILTGAADNELRRWLRRNRQIQSNTGSLTWDIQNNPLSLALDKRTAEWKRIKSRAQAYVNSLRGRARQLDLDIEISPQ